jgi:predicted acyl esterase
LPLVPGEIAEIRFSLFPISYLFRKDHSVRIAIAGADADQFDPVVAGSPVLHVHRGGSAASRIELPVVDRPSP